MNKKTIATAVTVAAFQASAFANDSGIDYSFSAKVWNNEVKVVQSPGTSVTTQKANGPILAFTAKKGDYFATVSSMLESSYTYQTVWIKRKDVDLTLGYRLNDNFSLIGGYKQITMNDGSYTAGYTEKISGVYLGASAFKMMTDSTYVYGNYSQMLSPSRSGTANIEILDSLKFNAYEYGLGYLLTKNSQLTAGYRVQTFKARNISFSRDEQNTMQGFIFGLNVGF